MDRSILSHATSSDDSPTPGYIYDEIAAMTKASYADCQKVQAFLLDRIRKKNHNVKYKCLLVIKHVCQKGRGDFKREMQRSMEDVKECLGYSGPPDPLRGDEIYRRVREAARETLEVIYADPVTAGAFGGGGGSGYLGGGGAYASGNRIEGFGSEPHGLSDPQHRNSSIGAMAAAAVGSIKSMAGSAGGGGSNGDSGYASYSGSSYSGGGTGHRSGGAYSAGSGFSGAGGGGSGSVGFHKAHASNMQGLGNYDPTQDKTWLERTSEAVKDAAGKVDLSRLRLSGRDGKSAGFLSGPDSGSGYMNFSPAGFPNNRSGDGTWTNGGNVGGSGSAGESASYGSYRPHGITSTYEQAKHATSQPFQWAQPEAGAGSVPPAAGGVPGGVWGAASTAAPPAVPPQRSDTPAAAAAFTSRTGGAVSDGGYERQQVEDLCAPGGTRSVPPCEELEAFVRNAAGLDVERLGSALLDCCLRNGADWRAQSKALAAMVALLQAPATSAPFTDFLGDAADDLEPLCASQKVAVRDKAYRLLRIFGRDPTSGSSPGDQPSPSQQAQSTVLAAVASAVPDADLLGYGDDEEPFDGCSPKAATAAAVAMSMALGKSAPLDDLLGVGGDLLAPGGMSESSVSTASNLVGSRCGGDAGTHSSGDGGVDNGLFGDMALKGSGPPAVSPAKKPSSGFFFIASNGDRSDDSAGPDLLSGFSSPSLLAKQPVAAVAAADIQRRPTAPAPTDLLGDAPQAGHSSSRLLQRASANEWEGLDPLAPNAGGPPPAQELRPQQALLPAVSVAQAGHPPLLRRPSNGGSYEGQLSGPGAMQQGLPFAGISGVTSLPVTQAQQQKQLQPQPAQPLQPQLLQPPPQQQLQQQQAQWKPHAMPPQQYQLMQQHALHLRQQQGQVQQMHVQQMQRGPGMAMPQEFGGANNGTVGGQPGVVAYAMLGAGAARNVIPEPLHSGGSSSGAGSNEGGASSSGMAKRGEADSFGFVHEALLREAAPG